MIKPKRNLLTAYCHADIAGLKPVKPRLMTGAGQGKKQTVQNLQPPPFERSVEGGLAITQPEGSTAWLQPAQRIFVEGVADQAVGRSEIAHEADFPE